MHDDRFPPCFGEELERDRPDRDPDGLMHLLWFVFVFIRPRRFFDRFARTPAPAITFACAVTFGVGNATDRIDTRLTTNPAAANLISSWTAYWVTALVAGLISAGLLYVIGGWWYRLRIGWSGAGSPDKALARRVYVYAAQIVAVPALIYALARTSMHADPMAMINAPLNALDIAILLTPLYSYVVSFIGVRTVFDVGRWRAAFWFLIMPSGIYSVAIGLLVVSMLVIGGAGGLGAAPPDVNNPVRVDRHGVAFSHPGNWGISESSEVNGYVNIVVAPPQDAIANIVRYTSTATADEELSSTYESYEEIYPGMVLARTIDRIGAVRGAGAEYTHTDLGRRYAVRLFVSDDGWGNMTEFHAVCLERDRAVLEPGYELIFSSIR
ncbi:MAG: Yip1 family protein [Planctomycetota bacterium]